jgi:methylase of polypeptide subunit release factors
MDMWDLNKEIKTVVVNDKIIFYSEETEGGGLTFGINHFVSTIKQLYPDRKFNNCLEWCSGPGFIGFDILSSELAENITLFDKYEPALEQAKITAKNPKNKWENRVNIILGDTIKNLSGEYDLIVGNPPHLANDCYALRWILKKDLRIWLDVEWKTHEEFLRNIKKNLSKDGVILLKELSWGSTIETFEKFINESGLKITNHFVDLKFGSPTFYYIEIKHNN